jgi:hypothetical protein
MTKADKEIEKIQDDLQSFHERLYRFNYLASNCNDTDKVYQANKLLELWRLMIAVTNGEKIEV